MTDLAPPPLEPRPAGGGSDRRTRGPTAQPRSRGVAARCHVADPRRDRDAIDVVTAEHFYKPVHGHVFEAITVAVQRRRAGRHRHGGRRAGSGRAARVRRRRRGARRAPGVDPGGDQRREVRRDRPRARHAAAAHRRRPARSPSSASPCPTTSSRPSTRPSR